MGLPMTHRDSPLTRTPGRHPRPLRLPPPSTSFHLLPSPFISFHRLAGILVLSAFHERGLPPHARPKALRTSNGIDTATLVPPGPNAHWRFMCAPPRLAAMPPTYTPPPCQPLPSACLPPLLMRVRCCRYAAWPTAGLQPLLERWGSIRKQLLGSALGRARAAELGSPTLHVYYGFPRWLETMSGSQPWYAPWRGHMEELLRQPGVVNHGMVNASTINRAYAASGFYLFPTDKPETSGVNLMKAQARHRACPRLTLPMAPCNTRTMPVPCLYHA